MESSSLAFNALASLPGPYIAAFVGKLGAEGLPSLLEGFEDDKTAVAEHRVAFSAGPGSSTPKVFVCVFYLAALRTAHEAVFFLLFDDHLLHFYPNLISVVLKNRKQ